LRSHPLTTERIADMQARVQLNPAPSRPAADVSQAMLAARAKVLSQNSPEALKAWTQDSKATSPQASPAQKAGALYAATLSHLQLRDMAAAERQVQALLTSVADDSAAHRLAVLLHAEVAAKQERFAVALQVLESLNQAQLPRPELIATAQALLRLPPHPARASITQPNNKPEHKSPTGIGHGLQGGRDAGVVEDPQQLDQARGAKVAAVIVGQRDGGEVFFQEPRRVGGAPERRLGLGDSCRRVAVEAVDHGGDFLGKIEEVDGYPDVLRMRDGRE
jgi:hypothetical protein